MRIIPIIRTCLCSWKWKSNYANKLAKKAWELRHANSFDKRETMFEQKLHRNSDAIFTEMEEYLPNIHWNDFHVALSCWYVVEVDFIYHPIYTMRMIWWCQFFVLTLAFAYFCKLLSQYARPNWPIYRELFAKAIPKLKMSQIVEKQVRGAMRYSAVRFGSDWFWFPHIFQIFYHFHVNVKNISGLSFKLLFNSCIFFRWSINH